MKLGCNQWMKCYHLKIFHAPSQWQNVQTDYQKGYNKTTTAQLNCSEMPFLYLLLSGNGPDHIMHKKGGWGFIHVAKLVHRPCCCWCALFDVCAQFNKAFIFKTRWWLALIFSNSVQGFSLGAAEWHSSYCFICASGVLFCACPE